MNTICRSCSLLLFLLLIYQPALGADYKYPGNKQVLVYSPGYDFWSMEELAELSYEFFNKDDTKFWDPDPAPILIKKDHDASLEMVKSFTDYGTVIIHTHGWYWRSVLGDIYGDEIIDLSDSYPGFRTGTVFTHTNIIEDRQHYNDLLNHRLAISRGALEINDAEDKGYHYVVFPSYIEKYVDALPDTFFYLGYCHSLQNDKMWNVLKSKGAKVAFGFSEEVQTSHDEAMFTALMQDAMLPHETTALTHPLTAQEAYNDIPESDRIDTGHINARFEKRVASAEWDNFVFKSPEVIVVALGSYAFVWDTETDDYAEINDSTGHQIQFPCLKSDLQDWLANHPPQQVDQYQWMNTGIGLANITIDNPSDRVRPDTSDCDTIYCNNFLVRLRNYDDIAYADYPSLLSYGNYRHVLSDNSASDTTTNTGIYMTALTGEFSLNNYEESYSHNVAGSDIVDNSVLFGSYNSGGSGQIILENSHIKQDLYEVQWQNTSITPQALADIAEQGHKSMREEDLWSVNSWLGPLAEFTVGSTTNSDWSVSCYGRFIGLGGYACPDTIQARTSIKTTLSLYDDTVFNPKYLAGLSTEKTIVHIIAYQYRLKKTETTTDSQGNILNSSEATLAPEFNVQAAFGSFDDSSQIDPFDTTEVPLRVKLSDAVKELIETHHDNSIVPDGGLISIDQIQTTINPL